MKEIRPLDFVRTPKGAIALVTEVGPRGEASINYLEGTHKGEHAAWWEPGELELVDCLPRILANATCYPFGDGQKSVVKFFGTGTDKEV